MNIKEQLSQELRKQGHTYKTLARKDKFLSEPKVRKALEGEETNAFVLSKIAKILGIETYEELRPEKPKLISLPYKPNTKGKPRKAKHTLDMAKDESCVRCGVNDGTIVSCHYTGIRQHALGKGTGHKCNDLASAFLCHKCHAELDQPKERKSIEASEEFLFCIVQTLIKKAER